MGLTFLIICLLLVGISLAEDKLEFVCDCVFFICLLMLLSSILKDESYTRHDNNPQRQVINIETLNIEYHSENNNVTNRE